VVEELHLLKRSASEITVSLIMLVTWEVWNKRKVFCDVDTMPTIVVPKIRGKAALWSLAGAKNFNHAARVIFFVYRPSLGL
jgi:hypothetical protein